jgi:hypothetical protein
MGSSINELPIPKAASIMSDICSSCRNLSAEHTFPKQGCPCCELIEHARGLLEACVSSHPDCRTPARPPLPSRVLDVGEPGSALDPFLYVPQSGQEGQYVTLSYCWGEDTGAFVTTTSSNIHKRRAGIPLRSLPTTLREAVYITRRLHIRYLWIDALCIIQGSEDDWTCNAANMNEIYGNAVLTFSAASASSCSEGVLTSRFLQHWKGASRLDLDHEPINHRAWTLQERLLARRFLSFGTEYLTWQCRTRTRMLSEDGKFNSGPSALRSYHLSSFPEDPVTLWICVVTDYTSRFLTNESDKLPALSGIAKTIQSHTGGEYLAGLWRNDILRQLCWNTGSTILNKVPFQKPKEYRAPSWSWACIDGSVNYALSGKAYSKHSTTEFVDCTVQPLSVNDQFGRVRDGKLVLRGPLKPASEVRWEGSTEPPRHPEVYLFGGDGSLEIGPVWPDIGPEYPPTEVRARWREIKLWCLQLSAEEPIALLLFEEHESNTYQRIGLVYLSKKDWFEDALVQTVTII